MKKLFVWMLIVAMLAVTLVIGVSAATTHRVASGDTMWKIAVR